MQFTLDWPALSFDIVPDDLGDKRSTFPLTTYLVAGTQAGQTHQNKVGEQPPWRWWVGRWVRG